MKRIQSLSEARKALTAARRSYLEDMQWLRQKYGIIQEPEPYAVKTVLLAALAALEKNDLAGLQKTIQCFNELHDQVLRYVVWDMLERTKRGLKAIRQSDPKGFQKKLRLWNEASWEKHGWRRPGTFRKYRRAIEMLARI